MIQQFQRYIYFILCMLSILGLPALATANTPTEQLATLLDHSYMSAKFKQTVTNGHDHVISESQGQLWLKKPDGFKWQVKKPQQQTIVSDGKELMNYDADLKQAIVKPVPDNVAQTPYLVLLKSQNTQQMNDLFHITSDEKNQFILKPKKEQGSAIKQVVMTFENDQLHQLIIQSVTGQQTKVQLSDVQFHQISDDTFKFLVPKGTDIIRQ